jgi:NAD(P)-dependent dehydrogenase (short-subunit alcohol dehydrogenase family)
MCKVFGQRLLHQETGGAIVNISSIVGKTLPGATAAYAASKAGLQALTVSMAKDVGPAGIRVNAICPGPTDTARLDDFDDATWEQIVESVPMRRRGEGEDIAAMTLFLCSDQGSWITGQNYNVDGGSTHW